MSLRALRGAVQEPPELVLREDVGRRLPPLPVEGLRIEPGGPQVEGCQVVRKLADHRVASPRDRGAGGGDRRGEGPREILGQLPPVVALGHIAIERVEHGLLVDEAKAELPSEPDVAREVLGEHALEGVHCAPPGNGNATALSAVVSTLV